MEESPSPTTSTIFSGEKIATIGVRTANANANTADQTISLSLYRMFITTFFLSFFRLALLLRQAGEPSLRSLLLVPPFGTGQ